MRILGQQRAKRENSIMLSQFLTERIYIPEKCVYAFKLQVVYFIVM
jgi:hypothetical protein